MFNQDLKDILSALSEARADFLLDAPRVLRSLAVFGAPLEDLAVDDLSKPGIVFQVGVEPTRIDILTAISGVDFGLAWNRRVLIEMEGVCIKVIGRGDLIVYKRASSRPEDIADVATLDPENNSVMEGHSYLLRATSNASKLRA